jgi:hypothetical protein
LERLSAAARPQSRKTDKKNSTPISAGSEICMAKTPVKLPLTVVDPRPTIRPPPRKLGDPGLSLWNAIQSEYRIDDAGGVELLAQACGAVDRIEALAARIAVDGEVIDTTKGPKPHPALRDELAARSFVCRTLERLGLSLEAVKPRGRPPGPRWKRHADE